MTTEQKKHDTLSNLKGREFNPIETFQLLKTQPLLLMCWGFRKVLSIKDKGLMFTVSGALHKGYVLITLAWNDTYTVQLFSTQWNEKAKYEGIYCDMLIDFIDSKVETK
jgi:hypothetical protein